MIQLGTTLPLDGDMLDPEVLVKFPAGLFDQHVVIPGIRFQEMNGQRCFRGTHGPDVP